MNIPYFLSGHYLLLIGTLIVETPVDGFLCRSIAVFFEHDEIRTLEDKYNREIQDD
jgi:hypothetical protein